MRIFFTSGAAIIGNDMFSVFQGKQSPDISVSLQDNMSASSTVTTVGASLRIEFIPVEMNGTTATGARATTNTNEINKILFRHGGLIYDSLSQFVYTTT
jgi:hypothetical protein